MNKLEQYSQEIGLFNGFTVESLIDSHRRLRIINSQTHAERMAELEAARAFGMEQGRQMILHGQYIEVEKLRSMTMQELTEFLYDSDSR